MDIDNKPKRLVFNINTDIHNRLRVCLQYDKMNQASFIRHIITGYLNNNVHIRAYMDEILEKSLSKNKKKNRKKDIKEYSDSIKRFGLEKDDIEDIFDILEDIKDE